MTCSRTRTRSLLRTLLTCVALAAPATLHAPAADAGRHRGSGLSVGIHIGSGFGHSYGYRRHGRIRLRMEYG